MIHKTLENLDEVRNAKIGDIIPMFNNADYLDGRMDGMILENKNDKLILVVKATPEEIYSRIEIKDIKKEVGIFPFDFEGKTKFFITIDAESDPNILLTSLNENDSLIKKYQEALK